MTLPTLVIGGAGFIGTALVKALIGAGKPVLVAGRRPRAQVNLSAGADYIEVDYSKPNAIAALLPCCAAIVDLAYAAAPKTEFSDPLEDLRLNAFASVGLFDMLAKAQWPGRLLVVSSGGTVYGVAGSLPLTEDSLVAPISPYGISKLAVERFADMYFRLSRLDVVIVRPANAYGLGQRPFRGQGFVATAMGCIARHQPVTIFGVSGTVRDYIHVDDVAAGMLAALRRGHAGQIYNIGSGIGRSNQDVLDKLVEVVTPDGLCVQTRVEPARGFDVPANVLDSTRLSRDCAWQPCVSFEQGLVPMWQDIRARHEA